MKVYRDPLGQEDPPRGVVLTIGNFDGVHIGHQAILSHVVERARELGATSSVMTLDPHPLKLLRPTQAPTLLTTLEQRLQLFERTGVDAALVVPFTHRLARMDAADFVLEVLVGRLAIREVYIGSNFHFGADRGGNVDLLQRMGRELGFVAAAAPTVRWRDEVVSSTRVRRAVGEGRVADAGGMLGRAVYVDGTVLEGKRLGRKLGFPTLNLDVENELRPAAGVYVTASHIPSFGRTFSSVTNIGVRPTVYESSITTVETHVLDFTADVYREPVRLFFLERLREERAFGSPVELMAQIRRDVDSARRFFAEHPLDSLDLVTPA